MLLTIIYLLFITFALLLTCNCYQTIPIHELFLLILLSRLHVKIHLSIHISIRPFTTGIVFHNYNGSDLSYTLRLRHETPTQLPGANKWFTQLRSPRFYPVGPRVYDKYKINNI